jgi:hypothetical protein
VCGNVVWAMLHGSTILQGQTVGSFRKGLKTVVEAIASNIQDAVRCVTKRSWEG